MTKKSSGIKLIIVESPTKAKTISKFLGKGYKVLSSFGHVRDLPTSTMGIDIGHDFTPKYVIPKKATKVVAELRAAAKAADEIYFATDEDREGEAISWHLRELLKVKPEKTKRITFHEITKEAIEHALKTPRDLDLRMVDAQQARRVLDRLVGYELSPFLWHKVARGLSAGRVQSVVVRLIVEREREVLAFKAEEYWSIEAAFNKKGDEKVFDAKLHSKDGETIDKMAIGSEKDAKAILKALDKAAYSIETVDKKKTKRSPAAPFTTSTLQQDGNNKLGFSAKQTMMLAQQLYEGVEIGDEGSVGLITYMRTDSVNLAEKFREEAADFIKKEHPNSVSAEARVYKTKSKGAQEAHEAIRPTSAWRTPESVAQYLDDRQLKLYDLIWRRALASQMADAEIETTSATIATGTAYRFRATGSIVAAPGFMSVYQTDMKENLLPPLSEGDALEAKAVEPKQHFTEPPPRYSEATLVKALEERGIGRPSTYAPTISTVVDRGYVEKEERRLKPTELAILVNDLLVEHFATIVDFDFTAKMEDTLDAVAEGEEKWVPVIKAFYGPFHANLEVKEKELSKKEITETATDEKCEKCGKPMIIKFGRFGKFYACSGYPECKTTKPFDEKDKAAQEAAQEQAVGHVCETCGAPMMVKRGRFGAFLSCSRYPECKFTQQIKKLTGAKCPKCKEGDIIEKRSRKGRNFYACSRYPACDFAMWSKPTGENCPTCGNLLVFAKDHKIACSDKECGFIKEAPQKEE
jgi:DNA topoisomerase-1